MASQPHIAKNKPCYHQQPSCHPAGRSCNWELLPSSPSMQQFPISMKSMKMTLTRIEIKSGQNVGIILWHTIANMNILQWWWTTLATSPDLMPDSLNKNFSHSPSLILSFGIFHQKMYTGMMGLMTRRKLKLIFFIKIECSKTLWKYSFQPKLEWHSFVFLHLFF